MEQYLFFAFIITFIWGTLPFFTKYVLNKIHYTFFILIQSILAFLIAMSFCYYNNKEIISDFKKLDIYCFIGILFIALSAFNANILYYFPFYFYYC